MKRPPSYTLNYADSLLSAFDISGSLLLSNNLWQPKDNQQDVDRLMEDRNNLEEDYKKAYHNVVDNKTS